MTVKTQIKEICTGGQNLKAKANLLLDDSFLIRDIRIVEGKSGLFISFPARRVDDKFVDVCFPLNAELREEIKTTILNEYKRVIEKQNEKVALSDTDTSATPDITEAEEIDAGDEPEESADTGETDTEDE